MGRGQTGEDETGRGGCCQGQPQSPGKSQAPTKGGKPGDPLTPQTVCSSYERNCFVKRLSLFWVEAQQQLYKAKHTLGKVLNLETHCPKTQCWTLPWRHLPRAIKWHVQCGFAWDRRKALTSFGRCLCGLHRWMPWISAFRPLQYAHWKHQIALQRPIEKEPRAKQMSKWLRL